MKCPNCGVSNGKTNKYCRECGTRLDVLAPQQDTVDTQKDEVGLGQELFKVIELFEAGDLDTALESGVKLAETNPGSASAHSIVALVYERKAERELAAGDRDSYQQFLKLAIEHYEDLIDLNPDSAADREKLASLRLKLTGGAAPPTPEPFDLPKALRTIPARIWAAAGAFLVVLFLIVLLSPPSQPKPRPTARPRQDAAPSVAVTPSEPAEPQLKVYTFPQSSTSPPSSGPKMPVPSANLPKPRISIPEVRPAKVPKIEQELDLVAEPKPAPAPKKPAPEPAKPVEKPAPEKAAAPTGAAVLAQAIRLHDQGKTSEAIGAANQAIVLYQADVDAGRNTAAASRGIQNARSLISVWQGTGE